MADRFSQIYDKPWVSAYVPMPLDLMISTGAKKQQSVDKAKQDLDTAEDPFSKMGDLTLSGKSYDRQGNIVDSHNTVAEEHRRNIIGQIREVHNKLSDDLVSGKITPEQFKDQSYKYNRQWAGEYDRLAAAKSNKDKFDKAQQKYGENKNFANNPANATDALEANTRYLNSDNILRGLGYNEQPIAENVNFLDEVKNMTFKDEGTGKVWNAGNFIYHATDRGTTADRVKMVADYAMKDPNSKIHQAANRELSHYERLHPEFANSVGAKDKRGNVYSNKQLYYNDLYSSFVNSAIAEHAAFISDINKSYIPEWASEGAKEKKQQYQPVYTSPGVVVKGQDHSDYFKVNTKTAPTTFSMLEGDKPVSKYTEIKDMPELTKKFALPIIQKLDPNAYNQILSGKNLTEEQKSKLYPMISQMNDIAKKDIMQSSNVVSMDDKDTKIVSNELFGTGNRLVKDLGTGNLGNINLYDPSTNKEVSLNDIKKEHDENAKVEVRSKFKSDNPYSFITGNKDYANARQLIIEGKQYILKAPVAYVDESGKKDNPLEIRRHRQEVANTQINNIKYSLIPERKNIYNQDVEIGFVPYDKNDRSKGEFYVKIIGKDVDPKFFKSPDDVEQYILDKAE